MNKTTFWDIMEKAKDIDTDVMFTNLQAEMSKLSKEEIIAFKAYGSAYSELVNETIWVDMACKVINGYVSDDTGLYFTLWLISRGEAVLLKALTDPDTLSELPDIPFGEAEFEFLMSVGDDENEEEYDEDLDDDLLFQKKIEEIEPTIKFKDGEKYGKYESFEKAMEDIPSILPKLIKRAEMESFDWKNYV